MSSCPDSPYVFTLGGEKQGLQIFDISQSAPGIYIQIFAVELELPMLQSFIFRDSSYVAGSATFQSRSQGVHVRDH